MGKSVFIAEKPTVAMEFAKALKADKGKRYDGYIESEKYIITWCVGHLVTMSYPEKYDESLKKWTLETLPFIPDVFKYEVIDNTKKQFGVVSKVLSREDVDTIYVCTDSGREGEYIYRLVEQMANVQGKNRKRVWIDSQTEEEILNGIKNAKDLSEYDNLSASAYLRAKEDYLMGINFSRVLTLKYGRGIASYLNNDKSVVSVGRVMTCVLGMVVRREREIRAFVKTPFYRVIGKFSLDEEHSFDGEWKVCEASKYFAHPMLYKDNGFKEEIYAKQLIEEIEPQKQATVKNIERKTEKKNPPLLFNLAELQNECSKLFKISPDETLKITQELYEKKLVTYPRTDARVLSTAVAKVIVNNIKGLANYSQMSDVAKEVLERGTYQKIASTRYVNDKQITDHYAIIPTGQGFNNLNNLSSTSKAVYNQIVKRFLCIFYPSAVYSKISVTLSVANGDKTEEFNSNFKVLVDEGYLKVSQKGVEKKSESNEDGDESLDTVLIEMLKKLKKNDKINVSGYTIKEGETSPPKRYNSGSMILAMENAGQLIEDDELRAQIKGSGIGTSATRAGILTKLVNIKYIALNKKTQIITPTQMGEMIYEVVNASIKPLLNPELTASWEKGLTQVADGGITEDEYMEKLDAFITKRTVNVKTINNQGLLRHNYDVIAQFYGK